MSIHQLNIIKPPSSCGEYREFIGIYKNLLNPEACQDIIKQFDKNNFYFEQRYVDGVGPTVRANDSIELSQIPGTDYLSQAVKNTLNTAIADYGSLFQEVRVTPLHSSRIKIQRTSPGGGYHSWHCENNCYYMSQRYVAWMIYLNDISEGGETEWLYQSMRVQPTEGTVVLWPAGYTHPHRGNPPLSETKYIATGWYELLP